MFVVGRHIKDNSIIVSEVIHYLQIRKHGKVGFVALKIDTPLLIWHLWVQPKSILALIKRDNTSAQIINK